MTVIEEIKDFGNDIKKGIGDKGFYILIAAAGAFGLYNLLKSDNGSEYVSATGYASYPEAGANADMIVDSINNEIWASHDEVVGAIESSESEIIQNMDDQFNNTNQKIDDVNQNINEQFEATNNYINEGLASQQQIVEKLEDTRQEVITGGNTVYFDRTQPTATNSYTVTTKKPTYTTTEKTIQIKGNTGTSSSKGSTSKTTTRKNATSSKASSSTKKTTSSTSPSTYNYTTKKGLNTSTSIVDALKATGANSSMAARKEIAAANGIKNYTGTAKQNTKMLNMMKSGDLVKPTNTKSSSSSSSKSSSSKRSSKKK